MKFILGQKLKMSQVFDEKGRQVPVIIVEAGPCQVLQIKTKEKDGYEAIQIGFKKIKKSGIKKTQKEKPFKYIREFPAPKKSGGTEGKKEDVPQYKVGQKIDASVFKEGDTITVSGVSKGKGFAGGVKRWGFGGSPATRGSKHTLRRIGSVGSTPGARVIKGKKMPGRMGTQRTTIKGLKVLKVDAQNNLLMIRGSVPGSRRSLLEIKSSK